MASHLDSSTESCHVADRGVRGIFRFFGGSPIRKASTSPYATYYNMKHPKRGLALIFNHERFAKDYLSPRVGTKVDCDSLSNCLNELGFKIKLYNDCQLKKIEKILKKGSLIVAEKNHEDHDCLVVIVLTYEKSGSLCAFDTEYNADIIWSNFTADKCVTLANKPKIFFIQACRSDKLETRDPYSDRTRFDSRVSRLFRLPVHSDILMAYSTVPGFYNLQYEQQGSWFIKELCSELSNNGAKLSLLTILTSVCRQVADHLDQRYDTNVGLEEEQEIPSFTTMLTRLITFTSKIETTGVGPSNLLR